MRVLIAIGLLTVSLAVQAEEAYPGQKNLAAGLACHRNLDMECARQRLEQALAEFSPEKDEQYIAHVREARWVLALIHVAYEELQKAEKEFKALLLLDPKFELPAGDHPPKVLYVFNQAKEARRAKRPAPTPPVEKPLPKPKPKPKPVPQKVIVQATAPRGTYNWLLSAEGRFVGLFGEDAEAVSSGPGAALMVGYRSGRFLIMQMAFGYAYHPAGDDPVLQAMSLEAEGMGVFELSGFGLRVGGGVGVLSMGTEDRYDHWGFLVRAAAGVAWPASGRFAVALTLRPSVVITAGGTSFYLPVGLAGEVRW